MGSFCSSLEILLLVTGRADVIRDPEFGNGLVGSLTESLKSSLEILRLVTCLDIFGRGRLSGFSSSNLLKYPRFLAL